MAKTDFLDDNQGRDYPFLKGTSIVPFPAIVACGFTMGPGSGYIAGQHSVFLSRVQRDFSKFWFYFTSNAPGLVGKEIIFVRNVDADRYELEYSDSVSNEFDSVSESESLSHSESVSVDLLNVCNYVDDFNGFLITGSLSELAELIPNDEFILGASPVEPALIQDLANTYARSINLANQERTKYLPPAGCEGSDTDQTNRRVYVKSTCLQGKVVFGQGYNSRITQNDSNKTLTFAAVTGSGEGEPCEQIPIYPGEMPPAGSMFLEGGPTCSEVVRSIAGTSGPVANILPEDGASIDYDPSNNTIIVNADLKNLAICGDDLLTADTTYYDCNHEAGQAGAGPGGGRGTTALQMSSFTLSAIGIAASPGVKVGVAHLNMGVFSTSGTGLRHSTSSSAMQLRSFTAAGSGTIAGQTVYSGSGDLILNLMASSGSGTFTAAPPPPPDPGGDIDPEDPEVSLPATMTIYSGNGGVDGGQDASDTWVTARHADYGDVTVAYAPRGESGVNGGAGGGLAVSNAFPSWLLSRVAINDGTATIHYGGNGDQFSELEVGEEFVTFYGGGGGGSAGPEGDGNDALDWEGGPALGGFNANVGYATSGKGGNAITEGDTPVAAPPSAPGGGGAGMYNGGSSGDGQPGQVILRFQASGYDDIWLGFRGDIYGQEVSVPETTQECEVYAWGGGGAGAGFYGAEYPYTYTGGGGGAYCKVHVIFVNWVP